MKNAFNNAVATIRDGINHTPSLWSHSPLLFAMTSAGAYAYTDGSPVAGLATAYFIFATLQTYHYEGKLYRESKAENKPPQP